MPIITKYLTTHNLDYKNTLLLNSLSGAIDIVDNETMEKIIDIKNTGNLKGIDDDLIKSLKDRGYLFDCEEDELNSFKSQKEVYNKYIANDTVSFVICPTMACNLRCTYCFESEDIRNDAKVMTEDQVANIFKHIEKIKSERNPNRTIVQLFGGEPLLPSTLKINERIFSAARESGSLITIISNGTQIFVYRELLEKYRDIIASIQITMDGIKDIHDKRRIRIDKSGTFDAICEGVDILLKSGIRTNLRVNVDGVNIESLREFVEFIQRKEWDKDKNFFCDIAPVTDHHASNDIEGLMPENQIVKKISELFPEYEPNNSFFRMTMFRVLNHINRTLNLNGTIQEDFSLLSYCEANILQFYVFSPDGYVYACPETVGTKEMAIGTFGEELNLIPEKVNLWDGRTIFRIPKCRECKIATFCGGGCAYAALKINNDIDCPVCDNAEAVLTEYIDSIKDYIIENYC